MPLKRGSVAWIADPDFAGTGSVQECPLFVVICFYVYSHHLYGQSVKILFYSYNRENPAELEF